MWNHQLDNLQDTPLKINMSPKKGLLKYIFQPSFFRGYVGFQRGIDYTSTSAKVLVVLLIGAPGSGEQKSPSPPFLFFPSDGKHLELQSWGQDRTGGKKKTRASS